ncbi:MAG TPA: hypothetical protein ACQGQG_02605 [Xylella sp.]
MTATEKKAQQEKWFGAETNVLAERAVRGELKDPDAVQFLDVRANYTDELASTKYWWMRRTTSLSSLRPTSTDHGNSAAVRCVDPPNPSYAKPNWSWMWRISFRQLGKLLTILSASVRLIAGNVSSSKGTMSTLKSYSGSEWGTAPLGVCSTLCW